MQFNLPAFLCKQENLKWQQRNKQTSIEQDRDRYTEAKQKQQTSLKRKPE